MAFAVGDVLESTDPGAPQWKIDSINNGFYRCTVVKQGGRKGWDVGQTATWDMKTTFVSSDWSVIPRFKVGDQVRCIESPVGSRNDEYVGQILTVAEVHEDGRIRQLEEWRSKGFLYRNEWFEKVKDTDHSVYSASHSTYSSLLVPNGLLDHARAITNTGFNYSDVGTTFYSDTFQGFTHDYPKNKPKTFMQKLTSTLKRVLNSDLQAQYKAGFLNGDLELTSCGTNALLRLVAQDYEAKLGAVALEVIAEAEKENK